MSLYPVITPELAKTAADHLSKNDPILTPIISRVGPCTIRPHKNYYRELVQSILGQQLSIKAAAAIEARFVALFDGKFPTPEQILTIDIEDMRAIGFSRPKARYVQDLASKIITGEVRFNHLDNLSNEEIITELTAVKGIGEWTVHMFLMFCMARPNVLPVGDLGIRNSMQRMYDLNELPSPARIIEIAETNQWNPYESIASWYIWKLLDNEPINTTES